MYWIHEYDVLYSQPIPRNAFFRPSRPNVSIHVPTTLWILRRDTGSVAKLATFVRPNLQTPPGVKMFPRTKTWDSSVNVAIRMMGARAGRDALFLQRDKWRVVRNGGLDPKSYDVPSDAGWRLSVRPCGADFCLLSMWPNDSDTVWSFLRFLFNHEDPRGRECHPPTMRRSWLAAQLRVFHAALHVD